MKQSIKLGLATIFLFGMGFGLAQAARPLVTEKLGPTYPISERDAIETITAKLKDMEKSGELKSLQEQAQTSAENKILQPAPVPNIGVVEKAGVRYFDPSWTLNQDIFDHMGNKIAAKGTRINPLESKAVTEKLFFFDGRDAAQVELAKKLSIQYGLSFTPVLTAGSWVDTSEKLQRAVYFDQMGKMTTRLTITSVPALVMQEGNRMRIEEMRP